MDTKPHAPARPHDDPLRWLVAPKSLLVAALLIAAAAGASAWDARHRPVPAPVSRPAPAVADRLTPGLSAAERAELTDQVVAELWPGLRDDLAAINPAIVEGLPREAPARR